MPAQVRVEEPLMNLAVFLDRPCVVGHCRRERGKGDRMTEDGLTGTELSCGDPLSRIRRKVREARRVCRAERVRRAYKSCVISFNYLFLLRL